MASLEEQEQMLDIQNTTTLKEEEGMQDTHSVSVSIISRSVECSRLRHSRPL